MKPNKILNTVIKLLISVVIVFLLLWKYDIKSVFNQISGIAFSVFVGVNAIHEIALLCSARRLCLWIEDLPIWNSFGLAHIAVLFSTILPGQLFGEGAKAVMLSRDGKNVQTAASAVIVDKLMGLAALFLTGLLGLIFSSVGVPGFFFLLLLGGIIVLGMLLFSVSIEPLFRWAKELSTRISNRIPMLSKPLEMLWKFVDAWKELVNRPVQVVKNFLWGCAFQCLNAAMYFWLGRTLGIAVGYFDYLWIFAVTSLVLLLPISFGGLGIREGTLVGLLGIYGTAEEKTLALSALMLAIQLITAAVGGGLLLCGRKRDANTK